MVDEQEFPISLDSPLDVTAGDQPVVATEPKFSFNRQKLIGGLLQNSVRYETDGWAAGWHVYNFDFIALGQYNLSPNNLGQLAISKGLFERGPRDYWMVRLKDAGLQFYWNFQSQWTDWLVGTGTLTRVGDNIARFTGVTNAATYTTFSVDCDLYTGAIIPGTFVASNPNLTATAQQLQGYNKLIIEEPSAFGANYLRIRPGKPVNSITTYEYDGIIHKWSDTAEWDGTNLTLLIPGHVLQSFSVDNPGTVDEVIRAILSLLVTFTEKLITSYEVKPIRNWHTDASWNPSSIVANQAIGESGAPVIDPTTDINAKLTGCVSPNGTAPIYMSAPVKSSSDAVSTHTMTIPIWTLFKNSIRIRVRNASSFGIQLYGLEAYMNEDPLSNIQVHASAPGRPDFTPANGEVIVDITHPDYVYPCPVSVWFVNTDPTTGAGVIAGKMTFGICADFTLGKVYLDNLEDTSWPTYDFSATTGFGAALNKYSLTGWKPEEISSTGPNGPVIRPRVQKYLFDWTPATGLGTYMVINNAIPVCFTSYSFFRVRTIDIVNKVWDVEVLPGNGMLRWDQYGLNIAELRYGQQVIQNGLPNVAAYKVDMSIVFELELWKMLCGARYNQYGVLNNAAGTGIDYQYYWPEWISIRKGLPDNDSFEYSKMLFNFFVNGYLQTAEQMLPNYNSSGTFQPVNQYAQDDDNDLRSNLDRGTFKPLVSNVFYQEFEFPLNATEKITGTIDLNTGAIQFTQNITSFTFVSFTRNKQYAEYYWELVLTKNYTGIELLLYTCFKLAAAGIVQSVDVVSVDPDGTINLTPGYGSIKEENYFNHPQVELQSLQTTTKYLTLYVAAMNRAEVDYLVAGMFWRNDPRIQYVSSNSNQLVFLFNGTQYTLTVDSAKEQLVYQATDLRTNEQREIWRQDCSVTTIFKKQFWSNDVGVENFWWIDQDHVLELSKYYFTLYKKTVALDDWGGNRWEILKRGPKSTFLTEGDTYWTCSWAYGQKAVFLKMRPAKNAIEILYIPDIINVDWSLVMDNSVKFTKITVPVIKVPIGALVTNAISAFVPLDPNGLIIQAKITATIVSNYLLIGFRVSRGMLQWTIKINGSSFSVFNGYGSVGLDGTLTGNQLPVNYCDGTGFRVACTPLTEFKTESYGSDSYVGLELTNKVYTDGSNFWFASTKVENIVSHFTFNNGFWSPVSMPLNNNLASKIMLEHWPLCTVAADLVPKAYNYFALLLPEGSDGGILSALGPFLNIVGGLVLPSVWLLTPLVIFSVGALGASIQTATVQRNSSGVKLKDGKDDSSIQLRSKMQKVSHVVVLTALGPVYQLLIALGMITMPIMSEANQKLNAGQDSSEVIDTAGRRLAVAIVTELPQLISDLKTSGFGAEASAVAAEYLSLNMFYCVGDNIECWSGPGFVNHNFREQIVVQSMNNYKAEWLRARIIIPFKVITKLLAGMQAAMYTSIAEFIAKQSDDLKEASSTYGNFGFGLAMVMDAVASLIATMAEYAESLKDDNAVEAFYDTFGARTLKITWPGNVNGQQVNIEPQHTFGDKPYSIFWPSVKDHVDTLQQTVVDVNFQRKSHRIDLLSGIGRIMLTGTPGSAGANIKAATADGHITYLQIPYGVTAVNNSVRNVNNMTVVEGITELIATTDNYKNQQVNVPFPQFSVPPIMDFPIQTHAFKMWFNASMGEILSVGVGDTKVIDGPPSNVVSLPQFLGIASSYTAIECGLFDPDYLRPVALTADSIGLNITGYNAVHDARAYHAFDNQFNRIVSWKGGAGLDNAFLVRQYSFIINNHFKRSNIPPPSEFYGKFDSTPEQAYEAYNERLYNFVTRADSNADLPFNVSGEDRDSRRYAIPVHSDILQTLPAQMRTIGPYPLAVMDGITSLTTELRNANPAGKAPTSIDFAIFDDTYRMTDEYIGKVVRKNGLLKSDYVTASAGLSLLGPTTKEAYLYAPATREYFIFGGGQEVMKKDTLSRFLMTETGRWDFINQEVVLRSLVDNDILKDDVSGYMVLRLDDNILGELYPPPKTIYNARSGFKTYSFYSGFTYQGPKRCIINRFIESEIMDQQIRANMRRWKKVSRYDWKPYRDYGWEYVDFRTVAPINAVWGWTHNPYRTATAMLSVDDKTDCLFEWELLFAWSDVMERLWKQNEYITVNIAAETVGEGGRLLSDPTHLFLYKELFKSGYYSTRYQSKNGMGNRERLYVWCDSIMALQDIKLFCKELTTKRTQPLATSQIDIQELFEQ